MKKVLILFGHILMIIGWTVLTQVGGLVYLASLLLSRRFWYRVAIFAGLYLSSVFLLVPIIAPTFGRERIVHSETIRPLSYFTVLSNRNYVHPHWNVVLSEVATRFATQYKEIQIQYLDANFPFINGFPLLPHLSHDDGKKLDLTLIYEEDGEVGNKKASWLGYGKFVDPVGGETETTPGCKSQGYWQYDLTKVLGWGGTNGLNFSTTATADMIRLFLDQSEIRRIFVEPHLKTRMGLTSDRVRFQGCHAVRHDDHIHLEIR